LAVGFAGIGWAGREVEVFQIAQPGGSVGMFVAVAA